MKCADCGLDESKPNRTKRERPHITQSSVYNVELCSICYYKRRAIDDPSMTPFVNAVVRKYSKKDEPEPELEPEMEQEEVIDRS